MSLTDEQRQRAYEQISELIHEIEPGSMVTRFVLLAEIVTSEGRSLWAVSPPGAMSWDSLGLIEYGKQLEQAQLIIDLQGDD